MRDSVWVVTVASTGFGPSLPSSFFMADPKGRVCVGASLAAISCAPASEMCSETESTVPELTVSRLSLQELAFMTIIHGDGQSYPLHLLGESFMQST